MSSSWAPNETDYEIYGEKIWLQAMVLQNIPYGVELTLFVMCFVTLLENTNRFNLRRHIFLLAFTTVVLGLGTVYMIAVSLTAQQAFIEYRNFPGGPSVYLSAMFASTVGMTNSVCWMISNWLLDMFLVWRFLVIYRDFNRSWMRMLLCIPGLMVCTSIGMSIDVLKSISQADGSSNSTPFLVANITLSFYVISLAANIIVTILIAGRLLVYRHRVQSVLGAHHAKGYANIATILVESAVLYSAFAFTFLIVFGMKSPLSYFFVNYVNSVQVCTHVKASVILMLSASLRIVMVAARRSVPSSSYSVLRRGKLGPKTPPRVSWKGRTAT
ncbi:uncharacterized protein C8Q71DRAFT_159063 [Rhodofomes roseus]|uniref:G-protein coupled receptors family 1 profile domain-containing protein n=1 Tax=Rhodofomes roseus TaxID=34475 RepID=A0ABQ8K9L9_9APHY|nr:uncharacterized protein C8Q71DRAFT_159063 [Rhodofomes roseus]KAH9834077.1 hypothetical protein C8Q71DRAFT_159063 [Rhodofomes roseus]